MPTQNPIARLSGSYSSRTRYSEPPVDKNHSDIGNRDAFLENFGAELTEAAYAVMLPQGPVANWLDLELKLWKVLQETVRKWDQEWPSAGVMLVPLCKLQNE
jgi:hypothetical protein